LYHLASLLLLLFIEKVYVLRL